MFGYIAQRLVGAVSVLYVVSVVSFGLYALTPGDRAVVLLEAAGIHSPPRDAVVGFTVAAGLIFSLMNLPVDVGIAAVDPRVRSL